MFYNQASSSSAKMDDEAFGLSDTIEIPELVPEPNAANENISLLKSAWVNETTAPEILPFETDLVEEIKAQLSERQEILDEEQEDPDDQFSQGLYQMEANRIKFSLAKYLRVRLQKIENYVHHILQDPDVASRLSEMEVNFAKEYQALLKSHLNQAVLDHLPSTFRSLEARTRDEDMVPRPPRDRFVVFRARAPVNNILIDESESSEPLNFETGDIHIMKYDRIKTLLAEHKVELI